MMRCARRFATWLLLGACWVASISHAQEIEPRAYSPSPSGMNFLIAVAGYSEGGVLTDPSLPVTDIEAQVDALGFGYGRTFGLAGHTANAALALPYVEVDATGNIGEQTASVTRAGW